MIRVNDQSTDYEPGMTVADLLKKQGLKSTMVAVWVNDELIPRGRHSEALIPDEANVQIVLMVSGG